MGDLPAPRTEYVHPFHTTGVDYAGPIAIRDRMDRGSKTISCYISLFICFSTRAIHLEIVSDLTTQCFLAAFRRFVSRRGKPSHMYSDNGKTFVGASSELKDLGKFLLSNEDSVANSVASEGVMRHFIPAYSPHMGGLWEAGVKSCKHHLKRVMSHASLTFEQC